MLLKNGTVVKILPGTPQRWRYIHIDDNWGGDRSKKLIGQTATIQDYDSSEYGGSYKIEFKDENGREDSWWIPKDLFEVVEVTESLNEYKEKVRNALKDTVYGDELKSLLRELDLVEGDGEAGGTVYVTEGFKRVFMFIKTEQTGKWRRYNWFNGELDDREYETLEKANTFNDKLVKMASGWPKSNHLK